MIATTHVAFADESSYNTGQYRSISLMSMPAKNVKPIAEKIVQKLKESDVSEVKWKKVKGAKNRFAAEKVIDICSLEASKKKMRVDVLIWDTHDERHRIRGRDDMANFQNMYIQLLKNVLRKRWSMNATWQLFPDENSILDWEYIKNTLAKTDRFENKKPNLLPAEWQSLREHFNIWEIAEVSSKETALVQAADLFAGLSVFSYEQAEVYRAWEKKNSLQQELFPSKPQKFSSKEKEHSKVLLKLLQNTKKYNLGVSNSQGLRTFNPSKPINFWLYQPQRRNDKAPLRK